MYNFMKKKLHQGRKRRWVWIINEKLPYYLIFDKETVKRSKNEEINNKSQKLTKKSRIMCQFLTWNSFSGSPEHCGINFRGWNFNIVSDKIYFYKKPN